MRPDTTIPPGVTRVRRGGSQGIVLPDCILVHTMVAPQDSQRLAFSRSACRLSICTPIVRHGECAVKGLLTWARGGVRFWRMRTIWTDEGILREAVRKMRDAAVAANMIPDRTAGRLREWADRLERRAERLAERDRRAKLKAEPE